MNFILDFRKWRVYLLMNKRTAVVSDFLDEIQNKKLFCYGAGRIFEDFINSYPHIKVKAVIDINKKNTCIDICDKKIPVISIESFIKQSDDSILLITCLDYLEVEEQLNHFCELDNVPYYVYCQMNVQKDFSVKQMSGKYQITEFRMQDYNAGHKAPLDVATIAVNSGYKALPIVRGTIRNGKEQTESEWIKACKEIDNDSIVLVQFPIVDISGGVNRLSNLKKEKNIKIICVVHDIEILRRNAREDYIEQYNMLKTFADIWIVHNNSMKKFLISKGFPANRIVSLGIFDYLIEKSVEVKEDDGIIIAGNLDVVKSQYIYHLNEIGNVRFNLYGSNYNNTNNYTNMNYFGTFLPDELISNLKGKYGLVWDGDSLDTCSGLTGEYLKINNPHKLSLYLAVGLPVIIWEKAAEAEFVLKENVGVIVKSLYELPQRLASVSYNDYNIMKNNVRIVGERLRKGEYMMEAIRKAEKIIYESRKDDGI